MKSKTSGLLQLILCVVIYVLFYLFYYRVLKLIGFNNTGNMIFEVIKHLLISLIVFVVYKGSILVGKNKFNSKPITNFIYCIVCFVFLIVVTILLHKGLNFLGGSRGISVSYGFENYFSKKISLDLLLTIFDEVILIPFLLCIIFSLGFSNAFKGVGSAVTLSGLTYGVIYAIGLNSSFEYAIFQTVTPAIIIMTLTYLYKLNNNIWSVIVTYSIYVLFGTFALSYIL